MNHGITTRYLPPTHSKGGRIKALASVKSQGPSYGGEPGTVYPERSLIVPYDHEGSTDSRHAIAAQALATKLGWSGLWIAGGKPEEDGNMYVNVEPGLLYDPRDGQPNVALGKEGEDWFYVAPKAGK